MKKNHNSKSISSLTIWPAFCTPMTVVPPPLPLMLIFLIYHATTQPRIGIVELQYCILHSLHTIYANIQAEVVVENVATVSCITYH